MSHAIVPREPDEAMRWAGDEAAQTCVKDDPCGKAGAHVWADMLAAAPPISEEMVERVAVAIGKRLGPYLAISPTPRHEAIVRETARAVLTAIGE